VQVRIQPRVQHDGRVAQRQCSRTISGRREVRFLPRLRTFVSRGGRRYGALPCKQCGAGSTPALSTSSCHLSPQPDWTRAPPSEGGGCRFESGRGYDLQPTLRSPCASRRLTVISCVVQSGETAASKAVQCGFESRRANQSTWGRSSVAEHLNAITNICSLLTSRGLMVTA
jgi:hypothetical protein